jgi:macrolide transport system ATP-binding/permease protein
MRSCRCFWQRLTGGRFRRRESELDEEFAAHVDLLTDENIRRGLTPDEARRAARITFGNTECVKEDWRDQRTLPWIEELRRDVCYALRGLRRSPGFTFVAVSCLALGIGAGTALFSLIHAVILRSLEVRDSGRLVAFSCDRSQPGRALPITSSGYGGQSLPYGAFAELQKAQTLSGVVAFAGTDHSGRGVTARFDGRSVEVIGELVSAGYFSILGVTPALGRTFADDDLLPGAQDAIVLSHAFWRREFAGAPSVLGRTLVINTVRATVIGVSPAGFKGLNPEQAPDIWLPLKHYMSIRPWGSYYGSGEKQLLAHDWWWCLMVGRLKSGVALAQAQAETQAIFERNFTAPLDPSRKPDMLPKLTLTSAGRGLDHLRTRFERPFRILAGAVVLILLITVTNMATLLLARAASRRHEISIRLSIGASRCRLVRQLLTESVVLSTFGGALGLLLAFWGSRALLLLMAPPALAATVNVGLDSTVLAFTFGLSVLTGVLFGLAPAFCGTRLRQESAPAAPKQHLARVLVGIQVALSVVLLFGAGLFVRTLTRLQTEEIGFRRDNLLLFDLDARQNGYDAPGANSAYAEALRRFQALPGVQSVSSSSVALIMDSINNTDVSIDSAESANNRSPGLYYNQVGPDFLRTYGIVLLMGRDIEPLDFGSPARTAVVNETFARRYLDGRSPIGRRFCLGRGYDPAESFEIVGFARDAKFDRVRGEVPPTAYISFTSGMPKVRPMTVAVRTAGDPLSMVGAVRDALRAADPQLSMMRIRTQTAQIDEMMIEERMLARVSTLVGVLAMLLVAIGLYGTLAFAVARRTSEIGIRMAIGASPARVSCGWCCGSPCGWPAPGSWSDSPPPSASDVSSRAISTASHRTTLQPSSAQPFCWPPSVPWQAICRPAAPPASIPSGPCAMSKAGADPRALSPGHDQAQQPCH